MANPDIGSIDCPVCGHSDAHVRESKHGRPYVLCDECGLQTFTRGEKSDAAVRGKMRAVAPPADPAPQPKPAPPPAAKPEPAPARNFWDSFFAS